MPEEMRNRPGPRYREGLLAAPEEQHRSLQMLVPAVKAGGKRQCFELVRIGGVKEEPSAAEPGPRHHPHGARVRDHHVAPDLAARVEHPLKLPQSRALIGQHMQAVETEDSIDAAVLER